MPDIYKDKRGYVGSVYRQDNHYLDFVEDRISYSKKGCIRGFHGDSKTYKLTSCLYGEIQLVVFDILTERKTEYILTPESKPVLIVPHTLNAHQCLSDECLLFYKWTEYYSLENQWTVYYNSGIINPSWKLPVGEVSDRDKNAPNYTEFKNARLAS